MLTKQFRNFAKMNKIMSHASKKRTPGGIWKSLEDAGKGVVENQKDLPLFSICETRGWNYLVGLVGATWSRNFFREKSICFALMVRSLPGWCSAPFSSTSSSTSSSSSWTSFRLLVRILRLASVRSRFLFLFTCFAAFRSWVVPVVSVCGLSQHFRLFFVRQNFEFAKMQFRPWRLITVSEKVTADVCRAMRQAPEFVKISPIPTPPSLSPFS